jgi:hypothetical protein
VRIFTQFVGVARAVIQMAVLLVIAAAIALTRTGSAVGAGQNTAEALHAAADSLETALGSSGSGITFDVVQRNTLFAKPDGPRIELRDPADPKTVTGTVDQSQISTIFSRGGVTADAFWMEMRGTQDVKADFDAAQFFARVLARDGMVWRDDGVGWYTTEVSPGVGMDPATARLLPGLLRNLTDAKATDPLQFDGKTLAGISGTSTPDDFPGVIAADGSSLTEKAFQVTCWFDDQGRLVQLEAHARNLSQTTYDLVSDTVVAIAYGAPGDPPDPTPTQAPQPLPTSDPASAEVKS